MGYPGSSHDASAVAAENAGVTQSGGKKQLPVILMFFLGLFAGFIINIIGYCLLCVLPKQLKDGRRKKFFASGVTVGVVVQVVLVVGIILAIWGGELVTLIP